MFHKSRKRFIELPPVLTMASLRDIYRTGNNEIYFNDPRMVLSEIRRLSGARGQVVLHTFQELSELFEKIESSSGIIVVSSIKRKYEHIAEAQVSLKRVHSLSICFHYFDGWSLNTTILNADRTLYEAADVDGLDGIIREILKLDCLSGTF